VPTRPVDWKEAAKTLALAFDSMATEQSMHDTIILALISGGTAVVVAVLGVIQQLQLARLKSTTEAVHVLVNSNMGAQLRISATALRRVAKMTTDPADEKIAEQAEKLLHEHEKKQAVVDNKGTK
jgi:hypothetical protein